jgi:hypothetical protein
MKNDSSSAAAYVKKRIAISKEVEERAAVSCKGSALHYN